MSGTVATRMGDAPVDERLLDAEDRPIPVALDSALGNGHDWPNGSRRVLIVDDHRLFGEALRPLFEDHGLPVIDVATTAARAMEVARAERPAMILVDIGLPDESGLDLGARILEELPETRIVAVTALEDPETVKEAVRLGFHGYLTKDTPRERFVTSIRSILDGQVVVTGRLGKGAAETRSPEDEHAALLARQLTRREREVLDLLGGRELQERQRPLTRDSPYAVVFQRHRPGIHFACNHASTVSFLQPMDPRRSDPRQDRAGFWPGRSGRS